MDRVSALSCLETGLAAGTVPAKDQDFVASLVKQSHARGLSEKQWYWVERLASAILSPATPKTVADFSKVYAMLQKAAGHLKHPKINLRTAGGLHVALYVSGERSRVPGVVNVTCPDSDTWYGRVYSDGRWEAGRGLPDATADVEELLTRMAADPEGTAAEYGRLSGACCFCNRTLKDERSTEVGYGKTCASRFGLSWGKSR